MSFKYWRVSFTDGKELDVEAEDVNIDGHNNLRFSLVVDEELVPVTVCNAGEWKAFRLIDRLEGEPLHTGKSPFIQIIHHDGLSLGSRAID